MFDWEKIGFWTLVIFTALLLITNID